MNLNEAMEIAEKDRDRQKKNIHRIPDKVTD
jgi:hypothetical protein